MRWLDVDITRHLLWAEGEVVVDEVRHHRVAYVRPALEALLGAAVLISMLFLPPGLGWLLLVVALAVLAHAAWLGARERRDVFVITNMRVFRVHGVLSTTLATMPLTRILDITVQKPLVGRLLGYGHFVFESAAQDQGLHDIRFVARPDQRDLAIQRVVQRAGLRGPVDVN